MLKGKCWITVFTEKLFLFAGNQIFVCLTVNFWLKKKYSTLYLYLKLVHSQRKEKMCKGSHSVTKTGSYAIKLNIVYYCFVGEKWLSSFSLPPNIGEIDGRLMERNQKMFSSLERAGKLK